MFGREVVSRRKLRKTDNQYGRNSKQQIWTLEPANASIISLGRRSIARRAFTSARARRVTFPQECRPAAHQLRLLWPTGVPASGGCCSVHAPREEKPGAQ